MGYPISGNPHFHPKGRWKSQTAHAVSNSELRPHLLSHPGRCTSMVFDVNFWQVRPTINMGKYGIYLKLYIYNKLYTFKFCGLIATYPQSKSAFLNFMSRMSRPVRCSSNAPQPMGISSLKGLNRVIFHTSPFTLHIPVLMGLTNIFYG